jgi:hypothetical protein
MHFLYDKYVWTSIYTPLVRHHLGVMLTTHRHLLSRSRMAELYLHSHICLHGVMVN